MNRNDRQFGSQQQQGGGASQQRRMQQGSGARGQFGAKPGSRQQSQQAFGARQFQTMAEVAMRGTAILWDLQMETARNLWRTQARTAALLGIPDYSELFNIGDERVRRLFSASAEQMLDTARQARDTVVEVQRQLGRLAEQQTIGLTQEVRENIEQIGRQTELGLQEIQQMTTSEAQAAEDTARGVEEAADEEDATGEEPSRREGRAEHEDAVQASEEQERAEQPSEDRERAERARPQRHAKKRRRKS